MDTQQNQNPKIRFYMQRPFGEKMNASFDFIKENWKILLKYVTYLILPVCLLQALSLNSFFGHYMGLIMGGMDSGDLDISNFSSGFFASYAFTMLFSMIGALLLASLVYALVKLYNDRKEGLVGVTFSDIRPLLFRNMGRLFILGLMIFAITIVLSIVLGVLVALTPFTLLLTIPALIAFMIALSIWPPVYLFEKIGLGDSLTKAIRLGFATWGGVFAILFVMGIIASVLQGVLSTPWYMAFMVKALLAYSEEGATTDPSYLYNIFVYLLAVILTFGAYISMVFAILGISYQYAHATEKMDSITVGDEIDNFENL